MTLQGIKVGDIVEIDFNGEVFFATVVGKGPEDHYGLRRGEMMVRNLCAPKHRIVTARRVVSHFRKSKASRSAVAA